MKVRKMLAVAIAGACLLMISMVPAALAAPPARVIIRPYYHYYPYYYSYGFYGPRWWYYPGGVYYAPEPVTGDVKIETHLKDASVYVDGGYAGSTHKLKKFALRPGNHEIEVRDSAGYTIYKERVQVLLGKTTDIKLPS